MVLRSAPWGTRSVQHDGAVNRSSLLSPSFLRLGRRRPATLFGDMISKHHWGLGIRGSHLSRCGGRRGTQSFHDSPIPMISIKGTCTTSSNRFCESCPTFHPLHVEPRLYDGGPHFMVLSFLLTIHRVFQLGPFLVISYMHKAWWFVSL